MFSKILFFSLLLSLVYAQSSTAPIPSGTAALTPCVVNCLSTSPGCTSYTDLTCVCTNTDYQNSVAACLQSNCTTAEYNGVLALEASECASFSPSGSGSASVPTESGSSSSSSKPSGSVGSSKVSSSGSGTPTGSGASSSSSASKSGSVAIMFRENGWVKVAGGLLAGLVGGGLLVL